MHRQILNVKACLCPNTHLISKSPPTSIWTTQVGAFKASTAFPSGLFFNPASLYWCGQLTYRPCGRLPFHWKKKGLSGCFSGNKNDFCRGHGKNEPGRIPVFPCITWLSLRPAPCLLCESSPLIFHVYGAPRVRWMGVEKGDITAFRQIPYERKKERLQLSSIKQWKHYKVIGSD